MQISRIKAADSPINRHPILQCKKSNGKLSIKDSRILEMGEMELLKKEEKGEHDQKVFSSPISSCFFLRISSPT